MTYRADVQLEGRQAITIRAEGRTNCVTAVAEYLNNNNINVWAGVKLMLRPDGPQEVVDPTPRWFRIWSDKTGDYLGLYVGYDETAALGALAERREYIFPRNRPEAFEDWAALFTVTEVEVEFYTALPMLRRWKLIDIFDETDKARVQSGANGKLQFVLDVD